MFDWIKRRARQQEPVLKDDWRQTFRRLSKELVPLSGEADTLQGELIRCAENLLGEAHRNGWQNWDVRHEEAIETLKRYLPEPEVFSEEVRQKIQKALERVRYAGEKGADKGEMAYDELDFLAQRVIEWCDRSEELFYKNPENIWLDENPF
ncbi:MAG: hypothetical protein QM813_20050 [Verrucomicrobiota bacterium]